MKRILLIIILLQLFHPLVKAQIIFPQTTKIATKKNSKKIDLLLKDSSFNELRKKDPTLAEKLKKFLSRLKSISYDEPEHRIEIDGLGNFSSTQNGGSIDPSANIYAKIIPVPNDPNFKFFLGYNLGAEIDSSKIDSIKLGSLFLPSKGRSGYLARIEYDILPLLRKISPKIPDEDEDAKKEEQKKYKYITELNPFIEYNYHKINIKDAIEDSSRIQTSTWIVGINFNHSMIKDKNIIGLQITPFYKWATVTDGTLGTYRTIFRNTLKGEDSPQTVKFLGLNLGLQINRFLFSFIFEDLKTKSLKSTPLHGGVYTLKATVIGDFLKL